jgi:uncharacterized protein (DUF58 family)
LSRPRTWLRGVTPLGRGVVSLALVAFALARGAGLVELSVVGAMCSLLVAAGLVAVLLPSGVRADLTLRPSRTTVGVPVHGRLHVENRWPLSVGKPIVLVASGTANRWARLPTIPARGSHVEDFQVPAPHRGVVPVGPVIYRRTDPVGLFSRRIRWAEAAELLIRPAMVDLEGLPMGQFRDLEGLPSDQISMSDLAFHALREYVPGDELRHVHWRSSARAGRLLVRQYHDTRRTAATLLVDTHPDAYASPDDFELALSVAASITARAARDAYELTLVCGEQTVGGGDPSYQLDAYCRAALVDLDLGDQLRHALTAAPEASLLFVVTGSGRDVGQLHQVLRVVPLEVWAGVLSTDTSGAAGLAEYAGRPLITLSALDQLPVAMSEVAR